MSKQEQVSWVSLVITILLAGWYFSIVLQAPPETDLHGPAMARLIGRIVTLAITLGVAGELLLWWMNKYVSKTVQGSTERDERDELINLRAGRNGYVALSISVAVVLVQIALIEMVQRLPAERLTLPENHGVLDLLLRGPLSALLVAQLLLLALTIAGICVYVSRIVYYRRGY